MDRHGAERAAEAAGSPLTPRDARREATSATLVALLIASGLTTLCALAWQLSLAWPMMRDLPILLYLAMLWDRFDVLPHAGFFDMNMLGSYVTYLGIGRTFGYDPVSVRYADLAAYLSLAGVTMLVMRHAGWLAGWVAAALFGLVYLQYGPAMSLQREYLMLLPLAAAVAAATRVGPGRVAAPALLAGLGIGAAMTIKPQAAIAAVPIGLFLAFEARRAAASGAAPDRCARTVAWLVVGASLPVALMFATLAWMGVLDEFLDIATNYLPLYGSLSGRHQVFEPGQRFHFTIVHFSRIGGQGAWMIAGAIGVGAYVARLPQGDPGRRRAALFAGLAIVFVLYPVLSGKYWDYHWLPMVYWLVLCASLTLARTANERLPLVRWAGVAALALMLIRTFPPADHFGGVLARRETNDDSAEQLGDFLRQRLLPGETVQAMDWTKGGVVHGMLLAEVKSATSFVYDFHFYHHVSDPYIQALRQRFLTELAAAAPRFILKSRFGPFPSGPDTDRTFPAFRRELREHYDEVAETLAYTIYERRSSPASETPASAGSP